MSPIQKLRKEEDKREFCVASEIVIQFPSCPVICCRVVSASHQNGKLGLGDVRTCHNSERGIQLAVYFEDKSQ